jgi:hypothetical protein
MRPKIRKVDTKKRKRLRKEAERKLQEQAGALLNHPKECCVCKTEFKRNKETVKTWHVIVREDRTRLTCPKCWDIINEAMEKVND